MKLILKRTYFYSMLSLLLWWFNIQLKERFQNWSLISKNYLMCFTWSLFTWLKSLPMISLRHFNFQESNIWLNNRIVSPDLSLLNTNKTQHLQASLKSSSSKLSPIFMFSLNQFFTRHLLFHLKSINTKTYFFQNTEKIASHLSS